MHSSKRVLIISNNSLSKMSNNGKTVLSLFEEYPHECLFQLFLRDEAPSVEIGGYYRITNRDVLRGRLSPRLRGSSVVPCVEDNSVQIIKRSKIKRNSFSCLVREVIWAGAWRSKQLEEWLDMIKPEIIFFVAGDTGYSYSICEYVSEKTGASINIFITDDYIIPRSKETFLDAIKRKYIYKKLSIALNDSKSFFTISEKMRQEYKTIFNKDSMPIFNVSESLRMPIDSDGVSNTIVYAGSLYYGRYDVIYDVAKCISKLNERNDTNLYLEIYSGQEVSDDMKKKLTIQGASAFCGGLNKTDLVQKLNSSEILLFVESFEKDQIEKTRLSLSTKISEYISVEKPILAIGPKEIGSMEFLSDVALCIDSVDQVENALLQLNNSEDTRKMYALKARLKYESMGDIHMIRESFIMNLCS